MMATTTTDDDALKEYGAFVEECAAGKPLVREASDRQSRCCTIYGALLRLQLLPAGAALAPFGCLEEVQNASSGLSPGLTLHIVGPDMREGQSPQVRLPVARGIPPWKE